jgi:serine phosphatase RsbU (regulator of sigma subunit)
MSDTSTPNMPDSQFEAGRERNAPEARFRLFFKFSIVISLILVLTMSITGLVLTSIQEQALIAEKEKSSGKLIQFVATISAFHIERFSYFVLHENAEMLQSGQGMDADVLSVIVRDIPEDKTKEGKKLHFNGRDPSRIDVPEKYWLKKTLPCVYHGGGVNKTVGSVEMIFSLESIFRTTANARLAFILIMLLTIVVIGVAVGYLLMKLVVRPLRILTDSAEQIAKGDFDITIDFSARDEIGFLGSSITSMSRELKESFTEIASQKEEIQKYSENLEGMVEQRTAELNTANQELTSVNRQLLSELEMARRVQQGIIPSAETFPQRAELSIGSSYLSMASVGGDLYDVVRIGRNSYGLLIADVSGHGVPAALITTMAKVSFSTHSLFGVPPDEICSKVNRDIHRIIADLGYYLTAYYGVLNLENGHFQFTNAGHHAAIVWRKKDGSIEQLDTPGLFIGISEDGKYETSSSYIEPGDRILMFTDGITEARNSSGEFFEYERLYEYINTHSDLTPIDFVDGLIKTVDAFCAGHPVDDDRAVLYVEFVQKTGDDKDAS